VKRFCLAKARFESSKLRTVFCFRQVGRNQAGGGDEQKTDMVADVLIDTDQAQHMRDVLPENLQSPLLPHEELAWRQFLQQCSFEQVADVVHRLQLLYALLHQNLLWLWL
jgi:hypothetical protein